jgi:uncharacterized protein
MTSTAALPFHLMAKPIGPLCNIRCEYCFYLEKEELFGHHKRSEYVMSDEVLESFTKKYIEAQPEGTAEVNFAWQGGEPLLLPQAFFEKAITYQQKYKRPGMRITNAVQTNGILMTPEMAGWFTEHDFLVGVSIDGDRERQNRYRKDREGEGTFDKVMAGIENLKAAGAQFNTLTVVQADNAEHPEEVYSFLKNIGSQYLQFIPIVEPVGKEEVSPRSVSPEQWGRFMNGVFNIWVKDDISKIYVQHFDMLLGIHGGYPSSLCVHAETCGKAMAIEHDGTVYSCDHFVFPENRLGNISTDDLKEMVQGVKQLAFGKGKRDNLPGECRECSWLRLCYGGCLKDRIVPAQGGMLNYLCGGYTALYAHTEPFFQAMVRCLQQRISPAQFRRFFQVDKGAAGRNDPCPCLSGKKYKQCHGRTT